MLQLNVRIPQNTLFLPPQTSRLDSLGAAVGEERSRQQELHLKKSKNQENMMSALDICYCNTKIVMEPKKDRKHLYNWHPPRLQVGGYSHLKWNKIRYYCSLFKLFKHQMRETFHELWYEPYLNESLKYISEIKLKLWVLSKAWQFFPALN